ncbi:MAG: transporter [Amycolatopsis sp.]|jgi:ABC-2 type transport system permease protein|uniref:ABC transporter permease n=1 Tax=Amycolatopsis sp. TaxID=37632 RepID=UPI002629EAD4|nr:ABC transporter permease [Amycolatopsis sp.]MCU1685654.1 transporter [Amycolatopsis sp.]
MNALAKLTRTEAKLQLRTPTFLLLGALFPSVILLAVGSIPGMQQSYQGGPRFIDAWAPSLIVMAITVLGLQSIPAYLATYRERGILRRLATTPVHPGKLLLAQLVINVVVVLIGVGLLLVVGATVFHIPGPKHPLGFALALVVGIGSVFGIGLLAAALARTSRGAGGLAAIALFPVMILGGVYLPRQFLPGVLKTIGEFTPPGVQALQDSWTGGGPQPLQSAVLAVFTVAIIALATRLFRWE